MRGRTITGLIAALAVGTLVLLAAAPPGAPADGRAPFWPGLKDQTPAVVTEWYSDVPWHQKLGTYVGNEINEPLVLPYEALSPDDKKFCTGLKLTPEDCMLEVGIVNVLGTLRTDSLYNPQDPKILKAAECRRDPTLPCIEVKLELSSCWTRSTGVLQPRLFGKDPENTGGATFTDGTTYAPQMPWDMAHYCDAFFPPGGCPGSCLLRRLFFPVEQRVQCVRWTWTRVRQVAEFGAMVGLSILHLPGPATTASRGRLKCTLVMGGFDLRPVPPADSGQTGTPAKLQYKKYNDFLLTWFNSALTKLSTAITSSTSRVIFPGVERKSPGRISYTR